MRKHRLYTKTRRFVQRQLYMLWSWLLLIPQLLLAQENVIARVDAYLSPSDTASGYWRVKTQANERRTLVQFFNAQHELIYQETLADQWIRLTKRRVRQFDELQAQLTQNALVSSRIRSERLPVDGRNTYSFKYSVPVPVENKVFRPYLIDVRVVEPTRLRVLVMNPLKHQLVMELSNTHSTYYYDHTVKPDYSRLLNLSQLPSGRYELAVRINNQTNWYQIEYNPALVNNRLQVLPKAPPQ